MPRRKITNEQAMEAINSVWPANQVEIEASALRAALESAGNGDMVANFRSLKSEGKFTGYVRLNADGSVTHVFTREGVNNAR